jgi:hypothetical protein
MRLKPDGCYYIIIIIIIVATTILPSVKVGIHHMTYSIFILGHVGIYITPGEHFRYIVILQRR